MRYVHLCRGVPSRFLVQGWCDEQILLVQRDVQAQ